MKRGRESGASLGFEGASLGFAGPAGGLGLWSSRTMEKECLSSAIHHVLFCIFSCFLQYHTLPGPV